MFFWRNRALEAELRMRQLLEQRVVERDQRINELVAERDQLQAKVDRMELVLLPLSSAAGAVYAAGLKGPQERKPLPKVEDTGWLATLRNHMKEIDDADKSAKEKSDGVPIV